MRMNRQEDKWTDDQKGKTDRQTDAQTDMNFELEETYRVNILLKV